MRHIFMIHIHVIYEQKLCRIYFYMDTPIWFI